MCKMSWMRPVLVLLALTVVSGCGVTIQTGPEDQQRLTEVSDTRAREIRADYAERIRTAGPVQKAEILKTLVDSVSAAYFRYGERMADDWQRGNQERGTEIPASEMRQLVERSNESQRPIFGAYEDILDLGMEEITREGQLDRTTLQLLDGFRNQFYKNYSAVFLPSGDVNRYRTELSGARDDTEKQSWELGEDLRRY